MHRDPGASERPSVRTLGSQFPRVGRLRHILRRLNLVPILVNFSFIPQFAAVEAKTKAEAETAYNEMVPILDRYANRGLIHKNKAARHKSRLAAHIKALA